MEEGEEQWTSASKQVSFAPPGPPGLPSQRRPDVSAAQGPTEVDAETLRKVFAEASPPVVSLLKAAGLQEPAPPEESSTEALRALYDAADAETRRLMHVAGVAPVALVPPTQMQELQAATKAHRVATQVLRDMLLKKSALKTRCDKIKSQYEMSLREFAEMAEQIKCQEQEVEKAKAQMQSTAEIPEPSMLPDIGAILQGVGVVLSPEQAEAVTRSFQAQVVGVGLPPAGRDAHMPEDTAMPQQEQPLVDARLVAQLREELASTKQALAQAVAEVNVARSASALPPPVEVEAPIPQEVQGQMR